MFKNYFKIALRNFRRNKSYALINTCGLAVGIASCLLIFLVVQFESSFDNFHANKNKIYRIVTEFHNEGGTNYSGGVPFPVAKGLRLDFPQIKKVSSIFQQSGQITINGKSNDEKKFQEDNFYYAEPQFFRIFNFPLIAGDAKAVLNDPGSALLTKSTAEKYFGNWQSALGKSIKYQNKTLFTVRGILKDVPGNSDFPLDVVVSYAALKNTSIQNNLDDWVSVYSENNTFIVLPDNFPLQSFNRELKAFGIKHKPAEYATDVLTTQPLSEVHYDERFGNFRDHTFSHSLIKVLSLIGIFLIVIACINFINLATAQAINRSKEVGVRKVLGSIRRQLVMQFMSETAFIVFIALVIAIGLGALVLPYLNRLLDVHMTIGFFANSSVLFFVVLTGLLVTLLAGIYPAIVLSGFNPVTALKSKITARMVGGISLRRGLVVLQFIIAQVLIIGMLVVVNQMDYFKITSMGFNKANIITLPLPGDSISRSKSDYVRDQLLSNSNIKDVSFSFRAPSDNGGWNSDFKFNHASKTTDFNANLKWADADYFKTYDLKFVAGRAYYQKDSANEFVVNQMLLKKLGIINPEDALGKEINFWDGGKVGTIVGVVKDFNVYSLSKPIVPVVLGAWKPTYKTINVKIAPGSDKKALPYIQKVWTASFPDYVYEYKFLDQTIANFYKHEDQLSQLYKIFAGIAIFISCLGLYGLVSFMAVQRTREVGIRKVLGASARSIIYLLSKEFSVLILIAFIIAAPVAWFIMHKWLDNYTYRIPLSASLFILAMISSLILSWITVAHRAIKAAIANPVDSLRAE